MLTTVLEFAWNVQRDNIFYYIPIILLIITTAVGTVLCAKFGKKFTRILVLTFLWANFALHFLKAFTPRFLKYMPDKLYELSFPNVCAIVIVLAPFIFYVGNNYWKDYLYYGGVVAGFLAMVVFPTTLVEPGSKVSFADAEYTIECARYYFCHAVLVFTPIWMLAGKVHTLNWHRMWAIPLIFTLLVFITAAQGAFFGMVIKHPWFPHTWEDLLNRYSPLNGGANQSMAFGPGPDKDPALSFLYPYLIPYLQTYHNDKGQLLFTPVVWVTPGLYLVVAILGIPLSLPFDYRRIGGDFARFGRFVKRLFTRKQKPAA